MTSPNKALPLRNWIALLPDVYRPTRREILEGLKKSGVDLNHVVELPLTARAYNEIASIEFDILEAQRDDSL